jgi:hypothetical protein
MTMSERAWDYATAVGLMAVAVMFVFGIDSHREDPIPNQLWGYWTTDAAGYENRYLELDDHYILIGVNEEDLPDLQRVSKVDCLSLGESLSCTIYSSSSEANLQMTLDYSPAQGGQVRIKNQRHIVWHRQPSS